MRIIAVVTLLLPFFICHTAPGETKALNALQDLKELEYFTQIPTEHDASPTCTCSDNAVTSDSDKTDIRSNTQQESSYSGIAEEPYADEDEMRDDKANNEDGGSYGDGNSISLKEGKAENDPNVIKQVIFIEPPEYIYKHEFNIQQPKKAPRTVIYVFPPEVKHVYNITDNRVREKPSEPTVYYLTMKDLLHMQEQLGSKSFGDNDVGKSNEDHLQKEIPPTKDNKSNHTAQKNIVDENKIRSDGFNLIDPRIGIKRHDTVLENLKHHHMDRIDEPRNPDQLELEQDQQSVAALKNHPSLETSNTDLAEAQNLVQQIPQNLLPEYIQAYKSKTIENYNSFYDNISEESQNTDFEIIPAILERHFYIGPDAHLYQK